MADAELPPEKERYFHRELSWLHFNGQVLEEALDPANPLLERLRFTAIFSSNLDEFRMVREAGLRRLMDAGYLKRDAFGWYPNEIFDEVRARIGGLLERQYGIYRKLMRELAKAGVSVKRLPELTPEQARYVRRAFENDLFPVLTPMAVDETHPFPVLPSRTVAYAVRLQRGGETALAIVPVPGNLGRLVALPAPGTGQTFILLEEVLGGFLDRLFRGYEITETVLFRVLRDSEISYDDEFAPDLISTIESELKKRAREKVVTLETARSCGADLLEQLCAETGFDRGHVQCMDGDLDLTYLFALIGRVVRPDLLYPPFSPAPIAYDDIFGKIREGEFLLHVPFQPFAPVIDLLETAADDPGVLAVKMTLYRTEDGSAVIRALERAARQGKQVTVLVELKARFDEERNIGWARRLEDAGCHVVHGIQGMKVHSKVVLVVRREEGRIRRYVHLGTGNYNAKTARLYTDLGLFSCNDDLARDVSDVFNVVTGCSLPSRWQRVVSAPYDLRDHFFSLIEGEIAFQKKYGTGLVFAKMNSLEDPKTIDKLYRASLAGVKVRLVVRGICCLVPGVPGLSDNIQVHSVIGRFLEHTRIFVFGNNGAPRAFLGSADWMRRNLDRRIELLFELTASGMPSAMLSLLEDYWGDTAKTRVLLPERRCARPKAGRRKRNIQDELIARYAG